MPRNADRIGPNAPPQGNMPRIRRPDENPVGITYYPGRTPMHRGPSSEGNGLPPIPGSRFPNPMPSLPPPIPLSEARPMPSSEGSGLPPIPGQRFPSPGIGLPFPPPIPWRTPSPMQRYPLPHEPAPPPPNWNLPWPMLYQRAQQDPQFANQLRNVLLNYMRMFYPG